MFTFGTKMHRVTRWDRKHNPYLVKWAEAMERDGGLAGARYRLISEYGYAVPGRKALIAIRETGSGQVIEIGAGTGYWASLLSLVGCQVRAFDIRPVGRDPVAGTTFYKFDKQHFSVEEGDHTILRQMPPELCLFLCWPSLGEPWAAEALKVFRGWCVAYVGEGRHGCCADDGFFEILEEEWTLVREVAIPRWYGMNDFLTIYHRKPRGRKGT